MKISDIRKLETSDLINETTKLREEIADLRRRLYLGEVQNTSQIRGKRRDLARMMTVMSEQLSKEAV